MDEEGEKRNSKKHLKYNTISRQWGREFEHVPNAQERYSKLYLWLDSPNAA